MVHIPGGEQNDLYLEGVFLCRGERGGLEMEMGPRSRTRNQW